MKNFMSNFNATKKISVTSVLFSLLILFFSLNGGFCTNFCSASNSDDNIIDDGYNNSDASRSEDNQNNLVDVNAFVSASGEFDQFYKKNKNNEEEDYKEHSPSGEDDDQKVKIKIRLNGEDQQETLNGENSQPDVPESRYGDLCPTCLML